MNFVCPQCARRYTIADERVRGRTINVRCKACQTIIPVTGANPFEEESTRALSPEDLRQLRATERALSEGRAPTAPPAAPAPAPVAPAVAPAATGWFLMVSGNQEGPLGEAEIEAAARQQRLTARTYAWKEGMEDWKRAGDVPELASRIRAHARTASAPPPPAVRQRPTQPGPAAKGPREPQAPLASIFDDVDLGGEAPAGSRPKKAKQKAAAADPFAALSSEEVEPPPPGEATQFFMAQAGVSRRNPPWKIAAFAVVALAVPAVLLYILSTHNVVRLPFGKPPARNDVAQEWESTGGDAALKAQMLGQRAEEAQAPAEEETVSARASRPRRKAADGTRDSGAAQAAALYALDEKQDTGPIARRAEARVAGPSGGEGPAPENIARVVGDRQAAFQSCVEQELRRNPRFRGGRVGLTVTVNGSGAVSAAELDRRDLQGMPVGDCITGTAKKMIFASFQGDPVQLVIPLVLTRVN